MWGSALSWIEQYRIGDLASIAGLVIAVIGFTVTVIGVFMSKRAAVRAEEAATATRDSIHFFESIVDFSSAITTLEEIKRLHRQNAWSVLPDRYSNLRKLLISIRESFSDLSDEQRSTIQDAIANFRAIEAKVDRFKDDVSKLDVSRLNSIVSQQVDGLLAILAQLKARGGSRS